jgi:hypothetical protein
MKLHKYFALLVLLAAALPLSAQSPKGWKLRVDRSMNAEDPDAAGDIKFVTMGSGFHATNPKAAVYWNPANTVTGNFALKGTFKLISTTGHNEYFGLIFGGSDLEGAAQKYLYFIVNSAGEWLIKTRDGSGTSQVASSGGPSDAVKAAGADGTSSNALEVHVTPDKIEYLVNGKVVHSMPKAGQMTNGIYGIRINHMLDVQIDGFSVAKQ